MRFSVSLGILAAGILAVCLTGCTGKNDPQQTAAAETPAATEVQAATGTPAETGSPTAVETPASTEIPPETQAPAGNETPASTEIPVQNQDTSVLEELTGYWQYELTAYLEITEGELILRDTMKRTMLQTPYAFFEENGKVIIRPEHSELAFTAYDGQVFGTVTEIYKEDGIIHLLYSYSYRPEQINEYLMAPTDESPFADIILLDDELLDELQGRWIETEGDFDVLNITGNTLEIGYKNENGEIVVSDTCKFHVITYTYNRNYVILIHEDLAVTEFYGFSGFQYKDGLLLSHLMVMDADWDTSISFKKDVS